MHGDAADDPGRLRRRDLLAALDLGTNNCRLLVAEPSGDGGFRVTDSFSRIVRLGEGLGRTGVLAEAAMERALDALTVCAARLRRSGVRRVRAVATQACRAAANGEAFIRRVQEETGLKLEVIAPEEEARLSVAGCRTLVTPGHDAALVLDVGGGSTELAWLDLHRFGPDGRPKLAAWASLPIGVVSLAERHPEAEGRASKAWSSMLAEASEAVRGAGDPARLAGSFAAGRGQVIGTSGAVTSLAALHMRLPRYERDQVDGAWVTDADCRAVTERLLGMTIVERGAETCIGPQRADLILAGAAILRAVLDAWPAPRVRVADRGLREGLLLDMLERADPPRRPRNNTVAKAAA